MVLAPTRWKLRAAIKAVNQVMEGLLVQKHPDKTYIGRVDRGFDFLGYRFFPGGLTVALQTVERCLEKVARLYEQGASVERIGQYLRRWWHWVRGGIDTVRACFVCFLFRFAVICPSKLYSTEHSTKGLD